MVRHIARSIELRTQTSALRLRENAALRSLEHLRKGVLLLNAGGRILFANDIACRMIDVPGWEDSDFFGLLGAGTRRSLAAGRGAIVSLPREGSRAPLRLALLPLREEQTAEVPDWLALLAPAAIAILTDPHLDADHRCAVLQARYGLTPAESAFVLEIGKGDGRKAAARRRGISVSTAHTHLNRIFEKTGVTRQAELVRLLSDDDA